MSREQKFSDEFLNAFVDEELAPEDKNSIYREIREDEAVNQRVCELRNLRELVRFAYASTPASGAGTARRARAARYSYGFAAAAAVAAGLLIGWLLHQPSGHPLPSAPAVAVQEPVKVLVHLNVGNPERIRQTLDEVENLIGFYRANGQQARVEVVVNGDGLDMLREDTSPYPERIAYMQKEYDNLTFAACQNTIDRLKREQGIVARLLPGVTVIDSGVAQIMRRQHQGWAYIRA
jgi:intracellular sulfur oxidation DsrE/DsrF family protein